MLSANVGERKIEVSYAFSSEGVVLAGFPEKLALLFGSDELTLCLLGAAWRLRGLTRPATFAI